MNKKSVIILLCALYCIIGFSLHAQSLGDVNKSGGVDIVDALLIAQYYVGLNPANFDIAYADTNCSGSVDIVDALLIAQLYVGLIGTLPCTNPTPVATPTPTPIATATPTPVTAAKSHAFLLLGQSNMSGYPTAQASDKVQNARIMVLGYDNCSATGSQTDVWRVAVPPLHECYQGAIGPGDWFAKTIIDRYPATDTIRLVSCAINGEKIETFMKSGGSKYSWIINRAKMAQQAGATIDGILFCQGESNNGQTDWPNKVKQLVSDIKADLGLGNIPFLAGELLYSGSCAGHNTLINQLPSLITNCRVISASGLVVDPADTTYKLHFDHNSQVTFGQRYAQTMIQLLGL